MSIAFSYMIINSKVVRKSKMLAFHITTYMSSCRKKPFLSNNIRIRNIKGQGIITLDIKSLTIII